MANDKVQMRSVWCGIVMSLTDNEADPLMWLLHCIFDGLSVYAVKFGNRCFISLYKKKTQWYHILQRKQQELTIAGVSSLFLQKVRCNPV